MIEFKFWKYLKNIAFETVYDYFTQCDLRTKKMKKITFVQSVIKCKCNQLKMVSSFSKISHKKSINIIA